MIKIYCNEALIEEIRDGNRQAEEELVEANKALIYKIIKDYYYASPHPSDMEDVFQAGCVGLLKAVKNYKPELGNKFVTYAYYLIRGEVQRICEEHQRREMTISSLNFRNRDGMIMESAEDIIDYVRQTNGEGHSEWTHTDEVNNRLMVEEVLQMVTPLQKKILVHRYYDGMSQQEIGDAIKRSQVFVSREEKRARKRIQTLLAERECTY